MTVKRFVQDATIYFSNIIKTKNTNKFQFSMHEAFSALQITTTTGPIQVQTRQIFEFDFDSFHLSIFNKEAEFSCRN